MKKILLFNSMLLSLLNVNSQIISEQKLTTGVSGQFGTSISVSENLAVVSAGWENTAQANKAGAVYVYEYNGTEWIEKQRITNPNGSYDKIFGQSVATNGNYIVITEPNAERAHIYSKVNSTWVLDTTFTVTDISSEEYGVSCDINDNNTVVIGSGGIFALYCSAMGSAYVYEKQGENWSNTARLIPLNGQAHDDFGESVSIDNNNTIAVGARKGECYLDGKGYVCIYDKIGTVWNETIRLSSPDELPEGVPGDRFGTFVDIVNNQLVVSADGVGAVYYFEKAGTWEFKKKIISPNSSGNDGFGRPISLNNNRIFIGASSYSETFTSQGAVYLYEYDGTNWYEKLKITPSEPSVNQGFGSSLYLYKNFGFVAEAKSGYKGIQTTYAYTFSSCFIDIYDTIPVYDTTDVKIYDTIPVYDTTHVTIYDTTQCNQIPTNGLVGYWPFNGNANDESGNGNNGTITGPILITDRFGNSNSAYSFNGTSDYILVPDKDNLSLTSDNFTFSFWIYTNPGPDVPMGVISKRRFDSMDASNWEYTFVIDTDTAAFRFWIGGLSGRCGPWYTSKDKTFTKGQWIHYLITADGTNIKEYKNGNLYSVGKRNLSCSSGNGTGPLVFGLGGGWNQMDYFNGMMDDIRMYNCALNSVEIQSLYHEGNYFEPVYDTIPIYDTTHITFYDTIPIYTTTYISVYDTIPVYDSIAVTDTLIIDVTITGINPPDNFNTLKVYPNPAKDVIFIHTGKNYSSIPDYTIKIINSKGQHIFESNITEQLFEVNVSTFGQTGLYFIQLFDSVNQLIEVRKIILE
jgi:hypothetical protein